MISGARVCGRADSNVVTSDGKVVLVPNNYASIVVFVTPAHDHVGLRRGESDHG